MSIIVKRKCLILFTFEVNYFHYLFFSTFSGQTVGTSPHLRYTTNRNIKGDWISLIKRFYVPTSKLEEGMQIDQVIKDRLDRTLIARGSALDAYLIEGLKKRGIHGVYIKTGEEDPEEKPEEETLTPFVRNKIEKYRTEDPRKVYL